MTSEDIINVYKHIMLVVVALASSQIARTLFVSTMSGPARTTSLIHVREADASYTSGSSSAILMTKDQHRRMAEHTTAKTPIPHGLGRAEWFPFGKHLV